MKPVEAARPAPAAFVAALASAFVLAIALLFFATPGDAAPDGPTPYPKAEADWPGHGAIRVFGWMDDNRKAFWQQRERQRGSIVFAGDSLVGGWGTMSKDLPGLKVSNRGIGGEPTRGLLFRFKEDVLDIEPKAIVIITGGNDLSAQQDLCHTRSNLVEMLDMAEKASPGVPIVLCTLPPQANPKSPLDPNKVLELNKVIVSVAQGRKNVAVIDLHALLADPDGSPHAEYFGPDRLHIAGPGYLRLRDALLPVFRQFNVG